MEIVDKEAVKLYYFVVYYYICGNIIIGNMFETIIDIFKIIGHMWEISPGADILFLLGAAVGLIIGIGIGIWEQGIQDIRDGY